MNIYKRGKYYTEGSARPHDAPVSHDDDDELARQLNQQQLNKSIR